ncbi:hypothetical protein [Bosea sp. ANAM02]|uniref:hypothetical protein n=1 Tax=Bosea sp. ANAM02 TaxID=2020412 RepID=UPI00140EB19F|nr:hypothetical protein [Bosea sp. ANAM02]BCB19203.1 hypothetical protein OCUBac02_20970 [Bosea sp. ANAM02]
MNDAKFRENDLFRGDRDNSRTNACVGDNGGRYDLYDYALGYFDAALILLRAAQQSGAIVDTLVYPACYSYRHSLELFMKWLVNEMGRLLADEELKAAKVHDLTKNWNRAAEGFQKLPKHIAKPAEIELIALAIRCVDEIDPNGETFRFSDDRKERQHLKEWSLINLTVLLGYAEGTIEIMKDWQYRLDSYRENR